jgi:hypothetical protein
LALESTLAAAQRQTALEGPAAAAGPGHQRELVAIEPQVASGLLVDGNRRILLARRQDAAPDLRLAPGHGVINGAVGHREPHDLIRRQI